MPEFSISSSQNPRVRAFRKLRDQGDRADNGLFIVEGPREIIRALDCGWQPVTAWVCSELVSGQTSLIARDRLLGSATESIEVSSTVWSKIAFGKRQDGILMVARRKTMQLTDLHLPENPLLVVLEGIEKPGNLGAVARTADAVGAAAILLAEARVDWLNPNVIRASAGAIFRIPVICGTAREILEWLKTRGVQIRVARPTAVGSIYDCDGSRGTALVFGSEAKGVTSVWHSNDARDVSLPMRGLGDSLNLSVTAAVMMHEIMRQRSVESGESRVGSG